MSGSARPIRGGVPLPEGRPYDLGTALPEQGAYADPQQRTAYLRSHSDDQFEDERAASYESQDHYVTRPVSAYAPMDPQIPSEILAGRGLY
jgi:rare lipoprotein A